MLRLHDTASGEVRPLELREAGKVSMYVCGFTADNVPHLGHGRFTLVYDVLRRYLEWLGFEVHHVSNVTDVDDKIIARAEVEGVTEADVVRRNEAIWYEVMDALDVARPHEDPHATDYIEAMVALVGQLVDRGLAYEAEDGVYLEVEKVPGYGLLARQPLESLRAGARVEVVEGKRSPLDFALWKKAKPGEPTWPSPWGPGRPGWHTECVVMSLDLLGDGFDVHGGGQDLIFPHHENERAQAVGTGRDFARHWVHNGWVVVEGQKMSKSLGNFTSLPELLGSYDARAYRLLVLQSHYRSPIEVTPTTAAQAETALGRLDALVRRAGAVDAAPDPAAVEAFRAAMDDDLDTPRATADLFELTRRANVALDAGDETSAGPLVAAVRELAGVLGLVLGGEEAAVPDDVAALVRRRDEARAARDWGAADVARDELVAAGWVVEDTPAGTRIRRA